MNYCLTSISAELLNLDHFGLTFVCGHCRRVTSVTLELKGDGIELCGSGAGLDYAMPKSSLPKLVWVRTNGGNLSISCGYCRSGKTAVIVSLASAGISSSKGSFANDETTNVPQVP